MKSPNRWRRFFGRAGIAFLIAFVLVLAPCPVWTPGILVWWQVPVVVVMLVCYLGVLLYDTLFWNRY